MKYKAQNRAFEVFIKEIETYFSASESQTLFQQRNTIKSIVYEGKKYAVKSFKIPHLLNQVVYRFFRASKAERSYENALKLQGLEINTPKPIGYREFPSKCLFKQSYYVSEFYDFDFEIRAVLADANFPDREEIFEAFVAFSYDLHNKGVYHVDYSPGNVIIKKLEAGYEFAIIDVNRMKFIDYDNAMRFKNLSRFSSSEEDLLYLAKAYAKLAKIDQDYAIDTLKTYHEEHQQYLRNKKRLKALKKKK